MTRPRSDNCGRSTSFALRPACASGSGRCAVEREERRRADALDRYLDALLQDRAPARPSGVDDVAAAVIALLGEGQDSAVVTAARELTRRCVVAQAKAMEDPMSTQLSTHRPLGAARLSGTPG